MLREGLIFDIVCGAIKGLSRYMRMVYSVEEIKCIHSLGTDRIPAQNYIVPHGAPATLPGR